MDAALYQKQMQTLNQSLAEKECRNAEQLDQRSCIARGDFK
jgi:hypothetical protein